MTDEKQIEEIVKIVSMNCGECHTCKFNDMRRFGGCTDYLIANELYEQGYRKIPENAVMLTKEEFDKLGLVVETIQEYGTENRQPKLIKEKTIVKKLKIDFDELLNQEIRGLQDGESKCKYFKEIDYGYRQSKQCYAQKCAPEVDCNGCKSNCEKYPKVEVEE